MPVTCGGLPRDLKMIDVRPDDFYVEDPVPGLFGPTRRLNVDLLDDLRRGEPSDREDVEAAVPLAHLIHDELLRYGTVGGAGMTDGQMREALLALRALVDRLGVAGLDIPFRDLTGFRNWWVRQGAHGSWQARRDLLSNLFEPLHERLSDLERRTLTATLVAPISPHARTGWAGVDAEITELRRHFQMRGFRRTIAMSAWTASR